MRRLEVRCCCQPALVLGSLPVPINHELAPGQRVKFLIPPSCIMVRGDRPHLAPRLVRDVSIPVWLEVGVVVDVVATLEDDGYLANTREALAFRSDELPVALLERIPGWQAA